MVKSGRILTICIMLKLFKKSDEDYLIIEGQHTTIDKFSFSVALTIHSTENGTENISRCGASVLNQRHMLTAAHCLDEEKILILETATGSTNREEGLLRKVHSFTRHRAYTEDLMQNDIGVFMLFKNLDLHPETARVALLINPPSENAEVAGWGFVSDDDRTDVKLMYTRQDIVPRDECEDMMGDIPEESFCALHPRGRTARGDSGSALVVRRYIAIGIVSSSRMVNSSITIYTNTSRFLRWIQHAAYNLVCGKQHKGKHRDSYFKNKGNDEA